MTVLSGQLLREAAQLRRLKLWQVHQDGLEPVAARLAMLARHVADLEAAVDGIYAASGDRYEVASEPELAELADKSN
jgi:hypothetical protein